MHDVAARPALVIPAGFVGFGLLVEAVSRLNPMSTFSTFDSPLSRLLSWIVFGTIAAALFTRLDPYSSRRAAVAFVAIVCAAFLSEALIGLAEAWTLRDAALRSVTGIASSRTFVLKSMGGATLLSFGWLAAARAEAFDRERRSTELRSQLLHARLALLRAQLHPHFLFNTLNSAATLASSDPRACREMVQRLGGLLRSSLEANDRDEVSVAEEMETLRAYVSIEEARFADRLRVTYDVDDALDRLLVPPFLLQPFVENAIRHGIAPRARGGRVEIRGARTDGRLILEVEDDGAGLDAYAQPREGVGLSNTRRRLHELYGDEQSLSLRRGAMGGVLVEITLPGRER
jgi:two-component sensor histidine kinase